MAEDVKPGSKPAESGSAPGSAPGKPVESASAVPGEKRDASRPQAHGKLARASESGDPAVHKAMADLYTAQQNAAAAQSAGDQSAALKAGQDEEVAKAQAALADLGYE